jgi:hypothetical protein
MRTTLCLPSFLLLLIGVTGCSQTSSGALRAIPNANQVRTLASATSEPQCSLVPSSVGGLPGYGNLATFGLSATDAWAVGSVGGKFATAHFNGSSWTQVPVPTISGSQDWVESRLFSVYAINVDDVWAVGYANLSGETQVTPILLNWNGSVWQSVTGASLNGDGPMLVRADSANDVWVAASTGNATPLAFERWNGATWSAIPSGNYNVEGAWGMIAFSPNDVWIGTSAAVLHWNGATMIDDPLPWLIKELPPDINDMSGTSDNDIWVVGSDQPMQYFAHHSNVPCGGDEGWCSYISPSGILGISTLADFRSGYAIAVNKSGDVLIWNGYDRWHELPADVPAHTNYGGYGPAAIVPHTTSFWTISANDAGTANSAELIQCLPNPD